MTKRQPSKSKRGKPRSEAAKADKYDLYQQSVQVPANEVRFFNRVYKDAFGEPPRILREDFCGTFAVSCEWVKGKADRTAIGVDLDTEPLDWGRKHNLAALKPNAQDRITLIQDDVRNRHEPKADVAAAQNFSYFVFKTREALRGYFRAAYENLAERGVLVLDIMGGSEVLEEDREDVRQQEGFKYIWEQHRFDPITHHATYHIHFRFPDGSEQPRVFVYDWRLWTIPEVRELLIEAGFSRADVYWEGTDRRTGEGNNVFTRRDSAPSDPAWVAYVVGIKQ